MLTCLYQEHANVCLNEREIERESGWLFTHEVYLKLSVREIEKSRDLKINIVQIHLTWEPYLLGSVKGCWLVMVIFKRMIFTAKGKWLKPRWINFAQNDVQNGPVSQIPFGCLLLSIHFKLSLSLFLYLSVLLRPTFSLCSKYLSSIHPHSRVN